MHTLFKRSKCSHESGHMYALIYNNILSCMLEPLPDHQEMAVLHGHNLYLLSIQYCKFNFEAEF